jgi:uncharacterized protein
MIFVSLAVARETKKIEDFDPLLCNMILTPDHSDFEPPICVNIPMRDGKRLATFIIRAKDKKELLPFIIQRTPYGAKQGTQNILGNYQKFSELRKDGYIFVFQDIRGRYDSQGDFIMNRPPCIGKMQGCLDEATDTYDTIEWLLKNVSNNNGRVGQMGVSYPGWLTNVSALNPHPALKALSPQATMGDTWMGDDFFHQGAFRLSYGLEYVWGLESGKDGRPDQPLLITDDDKYNFYLKIPALGDIAKTDKRPTWDRFVTHPAYDDEWQNRAIPRLLRTAPVPTLTVGGFWDQENMYGSQATYAAMEQNDSRKNSVLVLGPWYHGQWRNESGDSIGNIRFTSKTGAYYRQEIEAPWFACWLKKTICNQQFTEARVFDSGAQQWRNFPAWPLAYAINRKLFFHSNGRLSFDHPFEIKGFDQYISDPASPVPYRPRPIQWIYERYESNYGLGSRWQRWMTEDQRFVQGRSDVLMWQTEPLRSDVTIAGNISANLIASTTGDDADWIVKLIDVFPEGYPDEFLDQIGMRGYQLMIAGDIMRGRYHKSWQSPTRLPRNTPTSFNINMNQQAYTFRKGHRIMVQVQSSWFPLYDRNPQTWVENIFYAKPLDYKAQTHRIYRSLTQASYVQMQMLPDSQ